MIKQEAINNSLVGVKAVGYARISKEEQDRNIDEQTSIMNQQFMISSYAAKQGIILLKIYQEIVSGGKEVRGQFDNMITAAKNKEFSIILIKDWSRFSRDYSQSKILITKVLKEYNVAVIPIADTTDELSMAVKWFMNDLYRLDTGRKVKAVHKNRLERTLRPVGRLATGYKYLFDDRGRKANDTPIIDKNKSEIIIKIFKKAFEGEPIMYIAQDMDMPQSAIIYILKNKFYCGYIKYQNQWYKGQHKSLIKLEMYDVIQAKLKDLRVIRTEEDELKRLQKIIQTNKQQIVSTIEKKENEINEVLKDYD